MGKRSGKELRGTYETRLHVEEATAGALADYADCFSGSERSLFALVSLGKSLTSLKKSFCRERRIPSRMFNSLRVQLEERIEARRASLLRQQESLIRSIDRAPRVLRVGPRRRRKEGEMTTRSRSTLPSVTDVDARIPHTGTRHSAARGGHREYQSGIQTGSART